MFKLETPRDKDLHTIADFAELLCLVTPDRVLGDESLRDHIRDNDGTLTDDELEDTIAQLQWRIDAFGASYPFTIERGRHVLQAIDQLSVAQQLYVMLLLCANLPVIENRVERATLPDAFERTALIALKRIWPDAANALAFGKNETEYVGDKRARMTKLGLDIGARPGLQPNAFRERDTGDGGVDLVAWISLDRYENENIPSGLAQCACSREDWSKKQAEISVFGLGKLLSPTHPWMQLMFVPVSFRNNHGRWYVDAEVQSTVLLDRLRIIERFVAEEDFREIQAPNVLAQFLEFRIGLV